MNRFLPIGNHEEESEFRYGDDYLDTFDCETNWQVPAPIGGDGTPQCAMSYRYCFYTSTVSVTTAHEDWPCR